jgi:hypothetical protein
VQLVFWGAQYSFKAPVKLVDRVAMDHENDGHDGKNYNDSQDTIDGHNSRPQCHFRALADKFQVAMTPTRTEMQLRKAPVTEV